MIFSILSLVFLFLVAAPFSSADSYVFSLNSDNVSVVLNQSYSINHEGCDNASGCYSHNEPMILVAAESRSWYSVFETCSHEVYHHTLPGDGDHQHQKIESMEVAGDLLPWNLRMECLPVANQHVLDGELSV